MSHYPINYTKENFIKFLIDKKNVNGVVDRLEKLPDILHVENVDYFLNIVVTLKNERNVLYEFELNYYSPQEIKFFLPYKIFTNIENCLNVVEGELKKRGFL